MSKLSASQNGIQSGSRLRSDGVGLHEPAAGNAAMRLMLSYVFFLFNLYRDGLASLPRAWICPVMRVKTM
jgi:hypothetical protein